VADGLRGNEGTGGSTPGAWRTRDGRLWFAMVRGLAVLDPARAGPAAAPPDVELYGVAVDGRPQRHEQPVRLGPGARRLEVRYAVRQLLGQRDAWFRHRLVGLDEAWSEPAQARSVQYTFLPPGRYRLEVQARLGSGPWGPAEALEVDQRPPAWRSPLALAGAALALAAAGAGLWVAGWRRGRRGG